MPRTLQQLKFQLGEIFSRQAPRILIVEDLTEAQQHLKRTLRAVNANNVTVTTSAEAALKSIKSSPYDIILCDMNLTGMTGGTFLHIARTEGLLAPHSLFFMVSGEVQIDTLRHLLTQAPDEYIAKPFTQELLWRKLLKNLKLRGDRITMMRLLGSGLKPGEVLQRTMPKTKNVIMKSVCYRNLAAALEEYERYEEAFIVYKHASRLFDKQPPKWIQMGVGVTLQKQGLFNKAILVYKDLISRSTNNAAAHEAISICYESLGKMSDALQHAWEAMMLTGSNRQVVNRVERLSQITGDLDKQEESLYRLIRIDRRMNIDYIELVSKYLLCVYALLERDSLTPQINERFNSMLQEMRRFKKIPPAAMSNTYRAEMFFYISKHKLNQALSVKSKWDQEIARGKAKAPSRPQIASLERRILELQTANSEQRNTQSAFKTIGVGPST